MLFSFTQFIDVRTEVTNHYLLVRNRVFVLPGTFKRPPFHNLISTKKIITSRNFKFDFFDVWCWEEVEEPDLGSEDEEFYTEEIGSKQYFKMDDKSQISALSVIAFPVIVIRYAQLINY